MSRNARHYVAERLAERFGKADVHVDRDDDGGLHVKIDRPHGESLIVITGAEPGTVLDLLMNPPEE